jgi:hypothetical protein
MKCRARLIYPLLRAAALSVATIATPCAAAPGDKGRITGLSDVAFGALTNLSIDQRASQSLCAYSSSAGGGYSITAIGSGSAGAFTLSSGGSQLAYQVEWADSPNRTSGTALTAGTPLPGQVSTASNQNCNPSPNTSASLIIVLPAAELGSATTGAYSGTLTLVLAPL